MRKRIIKNSHDLKKAVEYFNFFHDGLFKSVKLMSGSKFDQQAPWEKARQYKSIEEKLRDTGLWSSEKIGLFIEIHHYNYDWPNRLPNSRVVLYLKNVRNVDPNIVNMVGMPIHDCETMDKESCLAMTFTFGTRTNKKSERITLEPLECEKVAIWVTA